MMTQLPSVFELMVGTRGAQAKPVPTPAPALAPAPASTAITTPPPTTNQQPSSEGSSTTPTKEPASPSSIPRIHSSASLPLVIISNSYAARKSSVHSIPEDPTSPIYQINTLNRRQTEPTISHQIQEYYPQPQQQQQHQQQPPVFGHAAHQQMPHQAPTSAPIPQAVPAFPPPTSVPSGMNGAPVYSPLSQPPSATLSYVHPQQQPDYFTRQRSSTSSSIDGITRTNSTAQVLNSSPYSPSSDAAPVHAPELSPGMVPPHMQAGPAQSGYGEYFPVVYNNPPPPPPQPQLVYAPIYQPQFHPHPQHYLGGPYGAQYITQAGSHYHHHPSQGVHSHDENNALINKRRIIKRRTRTGCLTCRKRRIKCDERKPHCYNCERSKKVCLGYESTPKKKPGQPESEDEKEEFQGSRSSISIAEEHLHQHPHDRPVDNQIAQAVRP